MKFLIKFTLVFFLLNISNINAKENIMILKLKTGEVKIETNNGTSWFATSGGFAEITEDKVELLLESIEKSNEIDVKRATEALERAKARKKNIDDNVYTTRLEASLSRALNRLKVSKK